MSEYIMQFSGVTRMYDEVEVLSNMSLAFFFGAKIGVLGPNGSGKSTLMRIMSGEDTDYMGEVRPAKGIRVGYFSQEPRLDDSKTVGEAVAEGVGESRKILDRYGELTMKLGEELPQEEMDALNTEYEKLMDQITALDLWDLDRSVEIARDAMRLPPDEAVIGNLSGGEKRRVALCQLLLRNPDLLLLDEPTNHLDAESVGWIERFLEKFPGTVVAVTHDRYFLDNVAGWILELDRQGGYYPYEGNYSVFLEKKASRLELAERAEGKRQKQLKRELDWVRSSPKARSTKNKARLQRYEELAAQKYDTAEGAADIQIPVTRPLGQLVVRAENLSKAFGEKLLFENLSFDLPPGGIVGVIGPNGAGKTTLFRIIIGQEQPDSGKLAIGDTVDLGYVDQTRDALEGSKTVYEEISGGYDQLEVGRAKIHARSYVGRFNFKGSDQQKLVGDLSGGERNRVHLAKLLRSGGNLILLDEPTNDLDVETLRSLEEGLSNFGGCAMVSSHDRYFLDRIATHILAFEGDSQVTFFEGNYQEYEDQRRRLLGDEADQPHRIRYKPLAR